MLEGHEKIYVTRDTYKDYKITKTDLKRKSFIYNQ